jgi:hypothetical protein
MSMLTTLAYIPADLIPIISIGGAFSVAIVGIVAGAIRKTVTGKAREQSRREIAAYVAEGSMSAEEGAKLLEAGKSRWDRASM